MYCTGFCSFAQGCQLWVATGLPLCLYLGEYLFILPYKEWVYWVSNLSKHCLIKAILSKNLSIDQPSTHKYCLNHFFSFKIQDLRPFTVYSLLVFARNLNGSYNLDKALNLTGKTLDNGDLGAPYDLKVERKNQETYLRWKIVIKFLVKVHVKVSKLVSN